MKRTALRMASSDEMGIVHPPYSMDGKGVRDRERCALPVPDPCVPVGGRYHAKWANALFESAILMVLSRFVIASPSRR